MTVVGLPCCTNEPVQPHVFVRPEPTGVTNSRGVTVRTAPAGGINASKVAVVVTAWAASAPAQRTAGSWPGVDDNLDGADGRRSFTCDTVREKAQRLACVVDPGWRGGATCTVVSERYSASKRLGTRFKCSVPIVKYRAVVRRLA